MSKEVIYQTAYNQLQTLNRQALRNGETYYKLKDALYSDDGLQVTVKKSGGYLYKFFIRYDFGWDTYEVRFGKMYTGNKIDRDDWCVFFVNDWETGVYAEDLYNFMDGFYTGRKKLNYHDIAKEAKES